MFGVITVFLLVFICALLVGHVLLYLTRPSKDELPLISEPLVFPSTYLEPEKSRENNVVQNELSALKNSYTAINERIKMAHSRLNELENAFVSTQSSQKPAVVNARLNNDITVKLNKLDNFKSNTEIELKAIKEIIEEIKRGKNFKSKKAKKLSEKKLSEQIHKLVFRSEDSN